MSNTEFLKTVISKSKKNTESVLIVKQITPEERQIVKAAVQKLGIRRPLFYHDAIIEKAKSILEDL